MSKNRKIILWITETAVFLAALIVVQLVTKPLGQYVTGSLVNLLLIISVILFGLSSGLTVALLSPLLAFYFGIGTAFIQVVPMIMLGNASIVIVVFLFYKLAKRKSAFASFAIQYAGILAGAVVKFFVLWLGIVKIILPLLTTAKPAQIKAMAATFSFPQIITALIGGTIAFAIYPVLKKAVKNID